MDEYLDQGAHRRHKFTAKSARSATGLSSYNAERFSHTGKVNRTLPHQNSSSLMNVSQHALMVTGSVLPTSFIGDKIVITEHPQESGVLIVYRNTDERLSNPDRLNLDRRGLRSCPVLEGEEQLRLLNYQHNHIHKIENLSNLRRLLFLDLYDNEIVQITGLTGLRSLRVLMLGKNKIRKIEGLETLQSLDVLDLHANMITEIDGLSRLSELRVLNLAGNLITHVTNLQGLYSLTELNLRRNKIRLVEQIDKLPNLQRLFLSFNEIANFDEISNLCDSKSLQELTIDANPLNLIPHYRSVLIKKLVALQQLDMKPVTDEERRMIFYLFKREDEHLLRKKDPGRLEALQEKRNLVLNQARQLWEAQQAGMAAADSGRSARSAPNKTSRFANTRSNSAKNTRPTTPSDEEYDEEEQERLQNMSKRSSRVSSAVSARHVTTVPSMPLPMATVIVTASYDKKSDRPPSGQQKQVARVTAMPRSNRPASTSSMLDSQSTGSEVPQTPTLATEDDCVGQTEDKSQATSATALQYSNQLPQQLQSNKGSANSQILSEAQSASHVNDLAFTDFTTSDQKQSHLIELDGDLLCLCGPASLNALDSVSAVPLSTASSLQAGGAATASLNPSSINRIYFLFVGFDQIMQSLHRIRARLPSLKAFKFRGNGITSLNQLNGLASLHRLESLDIDNSDDGNSLVSTCRFWREYAIFRLGHLGLRELNGTAIDVNELRRAEVMFSGVQTLATKYQRTMGDRSDQNQKDEKAANATSELSALDGASLIASGLANLAYCAATRETDQQASAPLQILSTAYADVISAQERKWKVARCWDHLFKLYVSKQLAAVQTAGLERFEKEQYEEFIRELANK